MGAEVWKIENPLAGDDTRFWGPPFMKAASTPVIHSSLSTANAYVSIGESAYFLSVNRNKHSLAINLKDRSGSDLIRELAQHADVLVENWMPGKLAEFGLDYASLSKLNPSLIYASLTGFGPSGPLADQPGYDVMASARGGLMHITGSPAEPSKVGVAITDITSGLFLQGAILAALFARERDPQRRGQLIETSLLEVQVAALANIGQNFHCKKEMTGRRIANSAHESIVPYQTFQCRSSDSEEDLTSTTPPSPPTPTSSAPPSSSSPHPQPQPPVPESSANEYFICGALNNKQFGNLVAAVQELALEAGPDAVASVASLRDPKFKSNPGRVKNRVELIGLLGGLFKRFSKRRLLDAMRKHEIPAAPINDLAQVFDDEQVVASGIVKTIRHPLVGDLKVTGSPLHFSQTPTQITRPPPLLGEHTQVVLQRVLGKTTDELRTLEKQGAIGAYHAIE